MVGAERDQLMGIRPLGSESLTSGAHLFVPGEEMNRVNSNGYITSVGYSPMFEKYLALGFLRDGRARTGQRIRVVDRLRNVDVLCEVCDPVFFDKEGEKLRA